MPLVWGVQISSSHCTELNLVRYSDPVLNNGSFGDHAAFDHSGLHCWKLNSNMKTVGAWIPNTGIDVCCWGNPIKIPILEQHILQPSLLAASTFRKLNLGNHVYGFCQAHCVDTCWAFIRVITIASIWYLCYLLRLRVLYFMLTLQC